MIVKSLRMASSSAVPNSISGILLLDAYDSDRRFTKSISRPWYLTLAVSKCFDCSGFDWITATLVCSSPREAR